jgi:subtilisin family serine protease
MRIGFWKKTWISIGGLALVAVIVAAGTVFSLDTGGAVESEWRAKLHGLEFPQGGATTFLVHLRDKADLSAAKKIGNFTERGRFVMSALKQTASQRQAEVVALLKGRKVPFKTFWITNSICVTANEAMARELAQRQDVEGIYPNAWTELEPQEIKEPGIVGEPQDYVEWNIEQTNAPLVWNEGITGEGIVVGLLDTGFVMHPAISGKYRGNNGNGTFDHNYNWFDGCDLHSCPTEPCDKNGHGTHVTGTIVGGDGPGPNSPDNLYDIGIAPGAKFISCRSFAFGGGTVSEVLRCCEWFLAPTDLSGANSDPARRPHIVNNSWGFQEANPAFEDALNAWLAAGILPVAGAGNSGPRCSTMEYPGAYPGALTVGALMENSRILAAFSSKGPVPHMRKLIKPDVVAGGDNVRSSSSKGGYILLSGTSMATPAVSGVAALVMSAQPSLERQPDQLADLLRKTADPISASPCSNAKKGRYPNMGYGWGLIDAYSAVRAARAVEGMPDASGL